MSSVDPTWPPPQESPAFLAAPPLPAAAQPPASSQSVAPEPAVQRPHRVAYVFAVIMPVILVAVLAAPLGVAWTIARLRQGPTSVSTPPPPNRNATAGEPGLGDPYYPQAGNSGYEVTKYQAMIDFDPQTQSIIGTTTISARATQQLNSFYFDLVLHTDKVTVNGAPAESVTRGFSDVYVKPAEAIATGSTFQVVVAYSGKPGEHRQGDVEPWFATDGEWTIAGEPESSSWWYPANDHPSDPALMDVSIRVPAGLQAISVGRLESTDTGNEKDFDTWHWIARQPMATYLNFITIGHYELKQGIDHGMPYVYAVSENLSAERLDAATCPPIAPGGRCNKSPRSCCTWPTALRRRSEEVRIPWTLLAGVPGA